MPTPAEELRAKIELENAIRRWAAGFVAAIAQRVRIDQSKGVVTPIAAVAGPTFRAQMREHYDIVASSFRGTVNDALDEELRLTDEETETLLDTLARWFENRAAEVTSLHMESAQRRLSEAMVRVQRMIDADDSIANSERPALVANSFQLRERAVLLGTVSAETQWAAETTKAIEVGVLLDELDGTTKVDTAATKVWRSQGDSRVRTPPQSQFNHLGADGQRVLTHEPFVVSGQLLRWPGDTGMGASTGNVYRCRCSAIYDVASVAELRRQILVPISPDLDPPPPTTESDLVVDVPFDL